MDEHEDLIVRDEKLFHELVGVVHRVVVRLNVEPLQRLALLHPPPRSDLVDREGSEGLDHPFGLGGHEQAGSAAAASHAPGEARQHVHDGRGVVLRAVSRASGSSGS